MIGPGRRRRGNAALASALVAGAVVAAADVHAEIYKWVDENGQVHFGERRPADAAAERVDVRTRRSPGTAATSNETQPAEEQQVREVPLTPEQRAQKRAEIERLKAAHAKRCQEARDQKFKLTTGGGRVLVESEDGSVATITDEAREQRIAEADKAIEESCNWTPDELAAAGEK